MNWTQLVVYLVHFTLQKQAELTGSAGPKMLSGPWTSRAVYLPQKVSSTFKSDKLQGNSNPTRMSTKWNNRQQ